jgi:putative peptidoglycan lipid II flippase
MIKKLFRNGRSFFFGKQTTILSAASVLMLIGLVSRILGLVRDRVLVSFFTPQDLDIYFAAARIPNFIFDIVVAGAISTAFIPVFSEYLARDEEEEAFAAASNLISLSLVFFLILAAIYFIFAKPISELIAPGFTSDQILLMSRLTRIMLAAQGFFILANFLTGIAQSFRRFIIPAISLALYNIGIIWGTALLSPTFGLYGPTVGMVVGAFLYLLVQIPLLRILGFRIRWGLDYKNPGVRKITKLMAPRMLALLANQVDATVDVILASLSSLGALTYFSFAQHLQFFPVSLFGLSIAQAALPTLSLSASARPPASSRGESRDGTAVIKEEFKKIFLSTLHQMFFLVIPVSVALLVLRIPLVRLAFGAAQFDWEATVTTGYVVAAFAISIFAQSATYLLARAFYALQDTRTPVVIQIVSIIIGIGLSATAILILKLPVWGLALSYSLATFIHAGLLLVFLHRKVGGFGFRRLILPFAKVSAASLTAGSLMYVFLKILDRSAWDQRLSFLGKLTLPAHFEVFVIDTRYTLNLAFLTFFVGLIGAAAYLLLSWVLKIEEMKIFLKLLRKFRLPFLNNLTI